MSELITQRDALFSVLPRWLKGFWGSRLMYAIAVTVDAMLELAKQALLARFPGFNSSANYVLCRDRKIVRGPNETDAQIEERLIGWLDAHRLEGHPVGQLQQLAAFMRPRAMHLRVVWANGNYWDLPASGDLTIGHQTWNWDGRTDLPARFWLLAWVPADLWHDDGTYADDGDVGDGGVIGIREVNDTLTGTTYGSLLSIAGLIKSWGSGNIRHSHTILIFDDAAWSSQQPDGTWNIMSHRNPQACYVAGDRVYR